MHIDKTYNLLLEEILTNGYEYEDPNRKGVMRKEIDSYSFKHSFKDGFPAISTKKLFYNQVITELIWFLNGDTNIKYLVDRGCNIWNKDAYNYYLKNLKKGETPKTMERFLEIVKSLNEDYIGKNRLKLGYVEGDLGPIYGEQWTNSNKKVPSGGGHHIQVRVNQIANLIKTMVEKPMSSELVVNAWNPTDIVEMALPPCHYGFQIIMRPLTKEERQEELEKTYPLSEGKASPDDSWVDFVPKYGFTLKWNQRSVDTFLGLPFNIASYATLALILENATGHKALGIEGNLSKVHLYDNSIEKAKEQLQRKSSEEYAFLEYTNLEHCFADFFQVERGDNYEQFLDAVNTIVPELVLTNYKPQQAIKVEMLQRNN